MQTRLALALSGLVSISAIGGANAAVLESYVFDRSTVYSSIEMGQVLSTGESLADTTDYYGTGRPETSFGDFQATFTWSDGTSASGTWSDPSGKNLTGTGPVLFPGANAPGVHFDFGSVPLYRAFIEQSGDTFTQAWEIRNGSSAFSITQVVLSALGTPDMGFDTDTGSNPGHGAGGFVLRGDDTLSTFAGNITVTYDWFNNWNNTTDMFHRMTIDFVTPLAPTTSMVFYQDTDETAVPVPAGAVLLGSLVAGAGLFSRTRKTKATA